MLLFRKLCLFACFFCLQQISFAQMPSAGIIHYKTSFAASIQVGSIAKTQTIDLSMELALSGKNYKITATQQVSASSNIQLSGMKMYKYYEAASNALYSVIPFRSEQYAVINPAIVADVKQTGKSKEILGYLSDEFTCTYNGVTAKGWYTKNLPPEISVEGNLGLPGMVMKFESERMSFEVEKMDWKIRVAENDVKLPAGIKKITRQEFDDIRKNG